MEIDENRPRIRPDSVSQIHLHIPNFFVGGIERWALSLIHGMPDIRFTVSANVGSVSHNLGRQWFGTRRVTFAAGLAGADVVLASSHMPFRPDCWTVGISHGVGNYSRELLGRMNADEYVSVSTAVEKACADAVDKPFRTILNGVDVLRCVPTMNRAKCRALLRIPRGKSAVGFFGRFSEEKQPRRAAEIAAEGGGIAVYVGPLTKEQQAEVSGIADCRFVSPEEADKHGIGNLYHALDLYVNESTEEGFGLSAVEAMAAGVPIQMSEQGVWHDLPEELRPPTGNTTERQSWVLANLNDQRMCRDWRLFLNAKACKRGRR